MVKVGEIYEGYSDTSRGYSFKVLKVTDENIILEYLTVKCPSELATLGEIVESPVNHASDRWWWEGVFHEHWRLCKRHVLKQILEKTENVEK